MDEVSLLKRVVQLMLPEEKCLIYSSARFVTTGWFRLDEIPPYFKVTSWAVYNSDDGDEEFQLRYSDPGDDKLLPGTDRWLPLRQNSYKSGDTSIKGIWLRRKTGATGTCPTIKGEFWGFIIGKDDRGNFDES